MKSIKMICGMLCIALQATAQEAPLQFYSHEDVVKPSSNAAYWNFVKNIKEAYQKNNVNSSWNTFAMDDNTCVLFAPMKAFNLQEVFSPLHP